MLHANVRTLLTCGDGNVTSQQRGPIATTQNQQEEQKERDPHNDSGEYNGEV
jgi:hypothetical protein